MQLVDVHAHLDHPDVLSDLDRILKRARANGVVSVIAQGITHESNRKVLELAERHDVVEAALGLYPTEFTNVTLTAGHERTTAYDHETALAFIEEHADGIVAIGEVGMDLKEAGDVEVQKENFRRIVQLAKRLRKPVIVHSRKAEEHVLDVLEEEECKRAVLHCFMGKRSLLERGVRMGLYFSIPSAVVRIEQFQQNVDLIPLGQLLTETDAPFLGVERDLPSEPAEVRDAVKKIAELKRVDARECAHQLFFNYMKLFQ